MYVSWPVYLVVMVYHLCSVWVDVIIIVYLSISTPVEGNDELVVCYPQDGSRTALIMASKYGHLQVIKTLIKAGVTVKQQNKVGAHHCHTSGWGIVKNGMETQVMVQAVLRSAWVSTSICPNTVPVFTAHTISRIALNCRYLREISLLSSNQIAISHVSPVAVKMWNSALIGQNRPVPRVRIHVHV